MKRQHLTIILASMLLALAGCAVVPGAAPALRAHVPHRVGAPISSYGLATTPLSGGEMMIGTQNGGTVNITPAQIKSYIFSGYGYLPVNVGGTGLASIPANGNLLIGNGSDYTLGTLTAGSNVSISNGPGTITISATGGSGGTPGGTNGQVQYNNNGVFGGLSTTGSGSAVLATSPILTTPNLGTPSAVNLANATFPASLPGVTSVNGVTIPATTSTVMTAPTSITAGQCALTTTTPGLYSIATCPSTGSGTVTSFAFTNGNGFTGTVSTPTTTPTLSLAPSFTGLAYSNGSALGAATVGAGLAYSSGTIAASQSIDAQTGTTYAIASTDATKVITRTNATSCADTLPQAGSAGFTSGFAFTYKVLAGSAVACTLTPTTSTINGMASVVVQPNMEFSIAVDGSGSNYIAIGTGVLTQVAALASGISVTPNSCAAVNTVTSTAYTISAPTQNAPSTATTGGTLAAATYYYVVTATTASGETTKSGEQSITTTGTTSSNTVNWTAVTGATGYRVYRGTAAGAENTYYSVSGGATVSYVDTGSAGTAASPPASNTSGQFTVNLPSGGCTPFTGEKMLLIVKSASSGTASYAPNASYGTGSTTGAWPANTGAAGDDDHIQLIYDGYLATPKWTLAAYNLGLH